MESSAAPQDTTTTTHNCTINVVRTGASKKDATARDADFLNDPNTNTASSAASSSSAYSIVQLHRSNLLRLQIDQLVDECRCFSLQQHPHSSSNSNSSEQQELQHQVHWASTAIDYLQVLKQIIVNGTSSTDLTLTPATATDAPFDCRRSDRAAQNALSVTFTEPLQVVVSCLDQTTTTLCQQPLGNAHVWPTLPLLVQIPNSCFEAKDYLRNRYWDKRNLVVWHVARCLAAQKSRPHQHQVYWEYQNADRRKPILLVVPQTTTSTSDDDASNQKKPSSRKKKLRFRVQIYFGMTSMDWMASPRRLWPNRCNLTHCSSTKTTTTTTKWSTSTASTPAYNHAIAEDTPQYYHDYYSSSSSSTGSTTDTSISTTMRQAALLLQIWALQRGLLRNHDGWQTRDVLLLLQYLSAPQKQLPQKQKQQKFIHARMAPQQILAAVWNVLADPQGVLWVPRKNGGGTLLPVDELSKNAPQHATTLEELYHHQYHTAVLLDPTGTVNYFGRWSASFGQLLRHEAQKSLACLHNHHHHHRNASSAFDYLFRTRARFWDRYDAYMKIPWKQMPLDDNNNNNNNDYGDYESVARRLIQVLNQALGDRVRSLRLLSTGNGQVDDHHHRTALVRNNNSIGVQDSDEIPRHRVVVATGQKTKTDRSNEKASRRDKNYTTMQSPTGTNSLVLGISINPDTCHRLVDRGPPADDAEATEAFLNLWGREKAQLRRFKDGAIVHAVVWGTTADNDDIIKQNEEYVQFQNDDKMQGGIVERIIRHIVRLHFLRPNLSTGCLEFSQRTIMSTIDSVIDRESPKDTAFLNPTAAHRMVIKAFDALSEFLRKHSTPTIPVPGSTTEFKSRLDIPLTIDAVDPVAPALRYAALHPPLPHPLLGGATLPGVQRTASGVVVDPILIQIRFGASSKWPSDLRAIGAAKTAMLIQLVNGIEAMKEKGVYADGFDGPLVVTPDYADIGFMGYVFRVLVSADPEIKLLQGLANPSKDAMLKLRRLTIRHSVAVSHHTLVHAVYTSNPSSSFVVRMARKWLSSHLLSDLIPFEALELVVCHAYSDPTSPLDTPGTTLNGFLRFLSLLSNHDWAREPMVVDPQSQFADDDRTSLLEMFEARRGPNFQNGPAMYIVSPCDRADGWALQPSFTSSSPEPVVLKRVCALAGRTFDFLRKRLMEFDSSGSWAAAFQETTSSFRSYSALFRTDPDLIIDEESSSTGSHLEMRPNKQGILESSYMRSMRALLDGPKELRVKLYRNLVSREEHQLLTEWQPVPELVRMLRVKLGGLALFFYNDLCPDVIAVLWRPEPPPHAFSAMNSELVRPIVQDNWKADTLVVRNIHDVLREVAQYTSNIVVDTKVFDWGYKIERPTTPRKRKVLSESDSVSSDSE